MTKIMNTYARMCDSVVTQYKPDLERAGMRIFSKEGGVIAITIGEDTIMFKEIRQAVPFIEGIIACWNHLNANWQNLNMDSAAAKHIMETIAKPENVEDFGEQMMLNFGDSDD